MSFEKIVANISHKKRQNISKSHSSEERRGTRHDGCIMQLVRTEEMSRIIFSTLFFSSAHFGGRSEDGRELERGEPGIPWIQMRKDWEMGIQGTPNKYRCHNWSKSVAWLLTVRFILSFLYTYFIKGKWGRLLVTVGCCRRRWSPLYYNV